MKRYRANAFETNSSSSHTLVYQSYYQGLNIWNNATVDFHLPVILKDFGGGHSEEEITDVVSKFSYVFQAILGKLEICPPMSDETQNKLNKVGQKYFKMMKKTEDKYLLEELSRKKHDEYDNVLIADNATTMRLVRSRFNRMMEMLDIVSEGISETCHVRLDFSALRLRFSDFKTGCIEYAKDSEFGFHSLDDPAVNWGDWCNTIHSRMEDIINDWSKALASPRSKFNKLKYELGTGELQYMFISVLEFAINPNCGIFKYEDNSIIEAKVEEMKQKNFNSCEVITW